MLNKEIKKHLKQQIKLQEIQKRKDRYTYLGLLKTYQQCGVKEFHYVKLNNKQRFLFKKVLHGKNAYKPGVYEKLNFKEKIKVKKIWQSGQRVINSFKNQVSNVYGNIIFSHFDALNFITKIPTTKVDNSIININTLKELGITYDDLILVFIKNKLLPKNFFSIQ